MLSLKLPTNVVMVFQNYLLIDISNNNSSQTDEDIIKRIKEIEELVIFFRSLKLLNF